MFLGAPQNEKNWFSQKTWVLGFVQKWILTTPGVLVLPIWDLCITIWESKRWFSEVFWRNIIMNLKLSSSPSRPVLFGLLPVLYLSLTCPFSCPLPVPYHSGLPRPHKGTGTHTILHFSSPPTTTKLFWSLYSPLGISHSFLAGHLPLS